MSSKHFLFALCLLSFTACAASAQSRPDGLSMTDLQIANSIHVSGTGEARAPSDEATFYVAVETEGETAKDAGEANAKRMNVLRSALLNAGLTDGEMKTGSYNVYPVYGKQDGPEPRKPTIMGYRATNQLSVKTLKLDQLGSFIDQALVAGANRVENVQFGLSNPEAAQAEALQDAVKRARASAEVIARSLGVKLGDIIEASTVTDPVRPMVMAFARSESMASTPIDPGEQTVTAQVQLRFAIGR
ncbi:MAG TPA: SIMPL domain-containing protein [Myxococcaceae bacterium]|nr:SIMPL domain-containing protein [Myxococcaceae bacterium]